MANCTLRYPDKLVDFIKKSTSRFLDFGAYSNVYLMKDGTVAKVYRVGNDPAYHRFVSYVLRAKKNRYLPNIYDVLSFEDHRVVIMERLSKIAFVDFKPIYNAIEFLEYDKSDKELDRVCRKLEELAGGEDFALDIHDGNIMMRGNQPVITDPLCY